MHKWEVYGPADVYGSSPLLGTLWATGAGNALEQAEMIGWNAQRVRLVL
jgi:hypothetical protein